MDLCCINLETKGDFMNKRGRPALDIVARKTVGVTRLMEERGLIDSSSIREAALRGSEIRPCDLNRVREFANGCCGGDLSMALNVLVDGYKG